MNIYAFRSEFIAMGLLEKLFIVGDGKPFLTLAQTKLLLKGCCWTLFISTISIVCGFILGLIIGIFSSRYEIASNKAQSIVNKGIKYLCTFYVTIFRGTPLFIQILIVYFGIPSILPINIGPLTSGIIALSLNSAAYLAENFRGGLNALPIGQWETALVLGYKRYQAFFYILCPQVFRNILPSITNEFISLIKESSILMVVGVPELTKITKDIVARDLNPMKMYSICAMLYLMMTLCCYYLIRLLNGKKQYDH